MMYRYGRLLSLNNLACNLTAIMLIICKNMKVCVCLLMILPVWLQAQAPKQTLSFITDKLYDEGGGIFLDMIETEDGGFLLLTSYHLFKIDNEGHMEWKLNAGETDITIDGSAVITVFAQVFEDNDGIYIYGQGPYFTPYYARLNQKGEMLFDTLYWDSYFDTLEPLNYINSILLEGNTFIASGPNLRNPHRDSTGQWKWDGGYYGFYKFDKQTGKRLWSHYDFFTESNLTVRKLVKLRGEEKGYLLYLIQFEAGAMSDSKSNHVLVRLDSLGRILSLNDMFPKEQFEDKGYVMSKWFIANDNNPFVGIPSGEPPRMAIGIKEADKVWTKAAFVSKKDSTSQMTTDFYITYDNEGKFSEIIPAPFGYGVGMRTYYIGGREKSEIFYIDKKGDTLWKYPEEQFPALPYVTRSPEEILPGDFTYFHTSAGGLLQVGAGVDSALTSFKVVRHINHLGWAFGYNPYAYAESDPPASAWFDGSGDLVVQAEMQQWHIRLTDMTGRELYYGSPSRNGFIHFDIPLSGGVYVVSFYEPETGKVWHQKIIKEGYN
ncbi:MAG: hypothetical protein M9892_02045 [Bacteroidetes bacterium]|nr:hypothetical protein [Bacteroidota bacterium]